MKREGGLDVHSREFSNRKETFTAVFLVHSIDESLRGLLGVLKLVSNHEGLLQNLVEILGTVNEVFLSESSVVLQGGALL